MLFKKKQPEFYEIPLIHYPCPECGAIQEWRYYNRGMPIITSWCKTCGKLHLVGQTSKTTIAVIRCQEFKQTGVLRKTTEG